MNRSIFDWFPLGRINTAYATQTPGWHKVEGEPATVSITEYCFICENQILTRMYYVVNNGIAPDRTVACVCSDCWPGIYGEMKRRQRESGAPEPKRWLDPKESDEDKAINKGWRKARMENVE